MCGQSINKIKYSWQSVWTKALKQTVKQAWEHKMLTANKKECSYCKHKMYLPFGCWFKSVTLECANKSLEYGKVKGEWQGYL